MNISKLLILFISLKSNTSVAPIASSERFINKFTAWMCLLIVKSLRKSQWITYFLSILVIPFMWNTSISMLSLFFTYESGIFTFYKIIYFNSYSYCSLNYSFFYFYDPGIFLYDDFVFFNDFYKIFSNYTFVSSSNFFLW